MVFRRLTGAVVLAALALAAQPVFAVEVCIKVVKKGGTPAVRALVTLLGSTARTRRDGTYCFRNMKSGEYQVIVKWDRKKFPCEVSTGKKLNTCTAR